MLGDSNRGLPVVDLRSSCWEGVSVWRGGADEVVAALRRSGFAYVVNHGVDPAARADVFAVARKFFGSRAEVRHHVHYRRSGNYRGYVPLGDPDASPGHKQSYDCGLTFSDSYAGPGAALRSSPNLWPDVPGFRAALEAYLAEVRRLADAVLGLIATGLGWPSDWFLVRCDRPVAQLRLLHYPRRLADDGTEVSIGAHSDYEALTILAQDAVGGLQVRCSDGSWADVEPVKDAFVLNVGEMLAMWTNDLLPATPHRVLSPRTSDRFSVAFFYATNYETVIEPPRQPGPTVPGPARYAPVATGAYLERRFLEVGG